MQSEWCGHKWPTVLRFYFSTAHRKSTYYFSFFWRGWAQSLRTCCIFFRKISLLYSWATDTWSTLMTLTGCRDRALYSVLILSMHVSDSVDRAKGQDALQDRFVKCLYNTAASSELVWLVQRMFMENQFANLFQLPDICWLRPVLPVHH